MMQGPKQIIFQSNPPLLVLNIPTDWFIEEIKPVDYEKYDSEFPDEPLLITLSGSFRPSKKRGKDQKTKLLNRLLL